MFVFDLDSEASFDVSSRYLKNSYVLRSSRPQREVDARISLQLPISPSMHMLKRHPPREEKATRKEKRKNLKDNQTENQPINKYIELHFIISSMSLKEPNMPE